jgi:hypothetical protein
MVPSVVLAMAQGAAQFVANRHADATGWTLKKKWGRLYPENSPVKLAPPLGDQRQRVLVARARAAELIVADEPPLGGVVPLLQWGRLS